MVRRIHTRLKLRIEISVPDPSQLQSGVKECPEPINLTGGTGTSTAVNTQTTLQIFDAKRGQSNDKLAYQYGTRVVPNSVNSQREFLQDNELKFERNPGIRKIIQISSAISASLRPVVRTEKGYLS